MAVDKTEPPIKVILGVAGLSISILVALRLFFVSYFNNAYESRSREHIDAMLHGGSFIATAARVHEEEQRRLGGIQAAMSSVAQGQRPAAITPTPSADMAALQGWTLAPHEVPRRAPPPPPAPEAAPAVAPTTPAAAPGNIGGPAMIAPTPTPAAAPGPAPSTAHVPSAPAPIAPSAH